MWFGQFIHGVLEEAYRRYDVAKKAGRVELPPWPKPTITEIAELIKRRLAAQGLFPWDDALEKLGDARAQAAINDLGPELFPLIHRAEVRLTGARELPLGKIPERYRFREADRYGLPPQPPESFEVIIDYKGMRRPPVKVESGPSFWDVYAWQVQTYAHLRRSHEDSLPVVAGIVLFVNELLPTRSDLVLLRREIRDGQTDVVPAAGSEEAKLLAAWRERDSAPAFPLDLRLARALRIVEVMPRSIEIALDKFDEVVARIETCRGKELERGKVLSTWETNPTDESTCTACDSRTYCPAYRKENTPSLPGLKVRA
jgi:hypothetical protein